MSSEKSAAESPEGSAADALFRPPPAAVELFGERLPFMEHLAAILATRGVDHGLIGPREVPRLWDRHIVNCALLGQAIPAGGRVVDVGSGAGLPGLVLAVARPDLRLDLVEPLERRVRWLHAAIDELGLTTVDIHRGKADAFWGGLTGDIVTSRAVARLGVLADWCLPLVPVGGVMLAMKGASVERELEEDRAAVEAAGGTDIQVLTIGTGVVEQPTRVVRVTRGREVAPGRGAGGNRRRGERASARGSRSQGAAGDRASRRSSGGGPVKGSGRRRRPS